MKDNILAAIDVGSSKICTLVAELLGEDEVRVLGVGITPSAGVKKGSIENISQATEAIAGSVQRAERSSGTRIFSAHVSIGGVHAQSLNNRGIATIPGGQRPITELDIDRAMEGARQLNLPTNREILHCIPRYFVVDGQDAVSDPIGMYGQRLDVDAHIVTGSVTAIQNLTQCVEGAGVQIEALVFSPLAAGEAVLEEEEKRQGVVLADIGGGTTEVAVYVEGSVFHTCVLPVGGYHLTHDLVAGLRAPFSHVEELKLRYGCALASQVDPDEVVELEAFGGERMKEAPRRRIAEILQARAEEMLEMVYTEVKRAGFDDIVSAGLVLTGGSAALPGLTDLAELLLRMPVRVGVPRRIHGLADALNSPAYATSVGLLHWAAMEAPANGRRQLPAIPLHLLPQFELKGAVAAAQRWLKTLIPK
jgi:cell division protein FtsA